MAMPAEAGGGDQSWGSRVPDASVFSRRLVGIGMGFDGKATFFSHSPKLGLEFGLSHNS